MILSFSQIHILYDASHIRYQVKWLTITAELNVQKVDKN